MDWFDKEEAYNKAYASGRVCRNLWQYIPQRLSEAVTNCETNSDGYWIWLDYEVGGWSSYVHGSDCGIIHEYRIEDIKKAIKTIAKAEGQERCVPSKTDRQERK